MLTPHDLTTFSCFSALLPFPAFSSSTFSCFYSTFSCLSAAFLYWATPLCNSLCCNIQIKFRKGVKKK